MATCDRSAPSAPLPLDGATAAVTAGAAAKLGFTVNPRNTAAGGTMPAVQVTALDALGNPVSTYTGNVTLAIAAGTGTSGATLAGTTTVAAVAGVASFATLSIATPGTGYKLTATATGLTAATSGSFYIAGPATALVFSVEPPSTATAGVTFTPAVRVTALDALLNRALGFTGNVTLAITAGTGTSGATLAGTTVAAASDGVASFWTLHINTAGTGYTLSATAAGSAAATSTPFNVVLGPAAKLKFTANPKSSAVGSTLPAVQVTALDAVGNPVSTYAGNVTLAITAGTGTSGATLAGTTTVAAAGGVATFATLSIATPGTGYTLTATATGLTAATSAAFNIAGLPSASKLRFTVNPRNTAAGGTMPAVQVTALDALGNPVSTYTGNVTLAIAAGTGTSGATLAGTTTVAAVGGVATFATLSIATPGSGYRLTATATGLTAATSGSFYIAGPATTLVFSVEPPPTTTAGIPFAPGPQLKAFDALGNLALGFTGNVTLAITAGTGTSGAVLVGTTTVAAAAGVVSFNHITVDKAGTGYTLTATATGPAAATSTPFANNPGPPAKLQFTVNPRSTTAGSIITPAVQVTVTDKEYNSLPNYTGNVTVAIAPGTGTSGATLAGTTTVAAVGGVATFSTLSIATRGTGYRLVATAAGVTVTITSGTFNIN